MANASDGNTRLLITRFFHDVAPSPVFALPAGPLSGNPLSFDGSASSDPDGTIAAYRWDFGDGSSAAGARSSHTYQSPGTYTVRLTVTDDKGLAATLSQSLVVAPGGPLTPSVKGVGVAGSGSRPPSSPPRTGAAASPVRAAPPSATATARPRSPPSRSAWPCWACSAVATAGRSAHGRHGRRCARYVLVGHFTHRDRAGHNSFHFTGRINRQKLSPGRYHMRAVPSAGGRLGGAAESKFTIVR